jgi:hypothetical protein
MWKAAKPSLMIIIQCLIIFWCGMLLLCWIMGVQLLPDKKITPPRATGWDGADIIYEDATGKLFKLGPDNRCMPVGEP